MYYQLTCSCGATHAVSASQAGQNILCACGKTLEVPTLRGLAALPVAIAPDQETRAIDKADRRKPSLALGAMFAVIFLAVPTSIFFLYERWIMDTSLSEQSDRETALSQIEKSNDAELSAIWYEFSTVSLGSPTKPAFFHVQKRARSLEQNSAIAAGIAVLAGIVAAGICVARRANTEVKEPQA